MKKKTLLWIAVGLVVVGVGVSVKRAQLTRTQVPVATPASVAPLQLAVTDLLRVERIEIARGVDVNGSVKAVRSALVKARVAGELQRLDAREGESVRAGQVLAQIDPTEFDLRLRQAELAVSAAKAQLDIARRVLTNNQALVAQGFISATALDTAIANEAATHASLNSAMAAVDLARKARADTTLLAPIDGVVSQRLAQPGERVAPEARLLEIVDLRELELEAAVAPDSASALRIGQRAKLRVEGVDEPLTATLVRINPSAQPGSRAVILYLKLGAHPALRQGLFARGTLETERVTVTAVAQSALRIDKPNPYLLVVTDGKVRQQTVSVGRRGSAAGVEMIEIAEGVAPGAIVLGASVGTIRDGTPVASAAAR